MSGIKTSIREDVKIGEDALTLDQYPDGSVRLMCDQDYQGLESNGVVMKFRERAMINLTKKEMMRLITEYLKNDNEWEA